MPCGRQPRKIYSWVNVPEEVTGLKPAVSELGRIEHHLSDHLVNITNQYMPNKYMLYCNVICHLNDIKFHTFYYSS